MKNKINSKLNNHEKCSFYNGMCCNNYYNKDTTNDKPKCWS